MDEFIINGGKALEGEVTLHGAKNSALPVLCATLLVKGESVIHNCPCLSDVSATLEILECLGCKVSRSGSTVSVDAKGVSHSKINECQMRKMRSSVLFLGALIARTGEAEMYLPGGCDIGTRPIDLHISSFRALGVDVKQNGSSISCHTGGLKGAKIVLPFASVGATENIIIAAATAKGRTTIINPAREPEICDLAEFLNKCGARIYGAGESVIEIEGVKSLKPCEHRIIPDRILASTYMSASAITSSQIIIKDIKPTHLSPVFPVYNEMGCRLELDGNALKITAPKRLKRVRMIKTMPYPAFPTDSLPLVVSALTVARGTSAVKENIFENRFRYISELERFGTDIQLNDNMAIINGVRELKGANVISTDLRGGAALLVAALAAKGTSTISHLEHIDRGYDNIEASLNGLGADIKRINNEEGTKEKAISQN